MFGVMNEAVHRLYEACSSKSQSLHLLNELDEPVTTYAILKALGLINPGLERSAFLQDLQGATDQSKDPVSIQKWHHGSDALHVHPQFSHNTLETGECVGAQTHEWLSGHRFSFGDDFYGIPTSREILQPQWLPSAPDQQYSDGGSPSLPCKWSESNISDRFP